VLISGCLFLLVSVRIRELIIKSIPQSLAHGHPGRHRPVLAIISLKSAGIVAANPATFVTLGDLHQPAPVMAIIGFLVIVALDRLEGAWRAADRHPAGDGAVLRLRRQPLLGHLRRPTLDRPHLPAAGHQGAISMGLLNVVLVFFLVELFDATGTLMGVATRAGLMKDGKMERLNKALMADSTAIVAGSCWAPPPPPPTSKALPACKPAAAPA
jgi:AGZA family xanthine/uracil permease-like MFS transporter